MSDLTCYPVTRHYSLLQLSHTLRGSYKRVRWKLTQTTAWWFCSTLIHGSAVVLHAGCVRAKCRISTWQKYSALTCGCASCKWFMHASKCHTSCLVLTVFNTSVRFCSILVNFYFLTRLVSSCLTLYHRSIIQDIWPHFITQAEKKMLLWYPNNPVKLSFSPNSFFLP